MAILKFKATCLAVLQRVRDTGEGFGLPAAANPSRRGAPRTARATGWLARCDVHSHAHSGGHNGAEQRAQCGKLR